MKKHGGGRPKVDLGQREFGLWFVVGPAPSRRIGGHSVTTYWRCLCAGCNRELEVAASSLLHPTSPSLGCKSCRNGRDDERRYDAALLDAQGLTCVEIGKRMGVSRGHAGRLAKEGREMKQRRTV